MFCMLEVLTYINEVKEQRLFAVLYSSYRKQMHAEAKLILGTDSDAEDAVQEVFLKLAKRHMRFMSGIKDERDRRNYLLIMVKNTARNMKRDRMHFTDPYALPEKVFSTRIAVSDDDAFVDALCDHMESNRVIAAIKSLDDTYKDVLYYHFVMEMTVAQTADILGRKEQTVKKQLVRGKKLLLEVLNRNGGDTHADD